jgi:ribonuclease P protein component
MQFIKKHSDYTKIQKNCKKFYSKYFIVLYQKNNFQNTEFRLGITVSKKVGNAVIRNKTKRRIKSFYRQKKDIMLNNNIDFILIAKNNSSESNWIDFTNDLNQIMQKLQTI